MNRYLIPLEIEADSPQEAVRIILTVPIQLLMTGAVVDVTDANTGDEYYVDPKALRSNTGDNPHGS